MEAWLPCVGKGDNRTKMRCWHGPHSVSAETVFPLTSRGALSAVGSNFVSLLQSLTLPVRESKRIYLTDLLRIQ